MENRVQVRACFTGCNIKSGKTVMQFELDPEHKGALPQLAMITGTFVTMELTSDQLVIPVDTGTGEVIDGQEQAFAEECEVIDGQELSEDGEDEGAYQLPPACYEFEDEDNEAA